MTKKQSKPAASGIDEGAEVVYAITVGGLDNGGLQFTSTVLGKHGIQSSLMRITPATKDTPGQINVPRLFTRWRGDEQEASWSKALCAEITKQEPTSEITLEVVPRAPLPGYPQEAL